MKHIKNVTCLFSRISSVTIKTLKDRLKLIKHIYIHRVTISQTVSSSRRLEVPATSQRYFNNYETNVLDNNQFHAECDCIINVVSFGS